MTSANSSMASQATDVTEPPNPLDEILARFAPDRLLADPRANGAGVTIAVVDSGLDRAALEARHPGIEHIEGAVFRGAKPDVLDYNGKQSTPHGTTVADIILSLAPNAKLYSADVFGPQGNCEVETVVAAIRHAMDAWNAKIINLSLGIQEAKLQQIPRRQLLLKAIEEAYYRDVLVIAAAHNEHPITRSFPAVYSPPLISVDKGPFADPLQFAYCLREQVEFQGFARGNIGPFSREPATSWATPHLTGIAARLVSLKPDLKPFELKAILYWMQKPGIAPSSPAPGARG